MDRYQFIDKWFVSEKVEKMRKKVTNVVEKKKNRRKIELSINRRIKKEVFVKILYIKLEKNHSNSKERIIIRDWQLEIY